MVGLPLSGTLAGTVGTALTNLEDRTHTHTGPSHTHSVSATYDPEFHSQSNTAIVGAQSTSASGTGATSASGTGATGTEATSNVTPYIQLTACQKN